MMTDELREDKGKDWSYADPQLFAEAATVLPNSLSLPAPSPVDSSGEDHQLRRRRRGLLRMYYGVENEESKVQLYIHQLDVQLIIRPSGISTG